ncbi:MAG: 3-dehydroquinate synthase, partial [Verrucomicrobia bacterium]
MLVDAGLLRQLGNYTRKCLPSEKCAIISDSNVAPLFADCITKSLNSAGFRWTLITIRAGEKSKTLEQVAVICDRMIAAGLDRQS